MSTTPALTTADIAGALVEAAFNAAFGVTITPARRSALREIEDAARSAYRTATNLPAGWTDQEDDRLSIAVDDLADRAASLGVTL